MSDSERGGVEAPEVVNERLADQLCSPGTYPHFISDCNALIASEMKKKGIALRTAFRVVQTGARGQF